MTRFLGRGAGISLLLVGVALGWSVSHLVGMKPSSLAMAQVEPIRVPPSAFSPILILDPETAAAMAFLDLALERLNHAVDTCEMALQEYAVGSLTADRTLELSGRFTDAVGILMTGLPDIYTIAFLDWMNGFHVPLNGFEEARERLVQGAYVQAAPYLEHAKARTLLFREQVRVAREGLP